MQLIPSNFAKEMLDATNEGIEQGYQSLWNALLLYLFSHWIIILIILIVVLLIASIRAIRGKWGMLGSVLYNYLYFGILFIVGLTLGPGIFASDLFRVTCTVILYPLCYWIVGIILNKTELKK